jgi:hypothetical protein
MAITVKAKTWRGGERLSGTLNIRWSCQNGPGGAPFPLQLEVS